MKALKLLVVALAATPLIASASIDLVDDSTLTYQLDNVFGYTNPAPNVPAGGWLTATFQNTVANTVQLTLSAANIDPGDFVTDWVFNFTTGKQLSFSIDPLSNPTSLSTANIFVGDNMQILPLHGIMGFDLKFIFPSAAGSDLFTKGETVVVNITAAGLVAKDFWAINNPPGTYTNPVAFYTAAEVAGIGTYNIAADLYPSEGGGGGSIPEPSTYAGLAGLAALALAYWRRRRAALFC